MVQLDILYVFVFVFHEAPFIFGFFQNVGIFFAVKMKAQPAIFLLVTYSMVIQLLAQHNKT